MRVSPTSAVDTVSVGSLSVIVVNAMRGMVWRAEGPVTTVSNTGGKMPVTPRPTATDIVGVGAAVGIAGFWSTYPTQIPVKYDKAVATSLALTPHAWMHSTIFVTMVGDGQ